MKKIPKRRLSAAFLTAAMLCGCTPAPSEEPPVPPVISEAMNHNRTILPDLSGTFYDWVEIHNPDDEPLSLEGYTLSDSEKTPRKWEFPSETVLPPGGYLIVFCSGEPESDSGQLHASFRISGDGEPILLCDPDGRILSKLEVPALPEDVSFGYTDPDREHPLYYLTPTPGAVNDPGGLQDLADQPVPQYSLRITEYTTSNSYFFYDRDGDCPAWAEIQNYGDEPVDLSGLLLSDDPYNLNKWAFPEGLTLEPGAYQLVLLSGKDRWADGELHADFRLGRSDMILLLSDSEERLIDRVELVELRDNASFGLVPDSEGVWAYYARPTPGTENSTAHFETLQAGTSLPAREVWISEAMAVSGSQSDWESDWIELMNGSDHPVDLTGWGLSDSGSELGAYRFPETVLDPGTTLLLRADGQELPFQLSAAGESLFLTRPDGSLCDCFETGRQQNGISSGRPAGTEDRRCFFKEPTPDAPNGEGAAGLTALPVFSRDSLYLSAGDAVELSGEGEIRYTLDGTVPDADSTLYEGPISIDSNTVIRAGCFSGDRICGGIATRTYLTDEPHALDVICLSTAPGNLFDPDTGIYEFGPSYDPEFPYVGANFWQDWERPVHFAFYSADGAPGIDFDAGIRIFGQYSRAIPQKSISVHLRESYGPSQVRFPFFEGSGVTEYHDLLLRSAGQDWGMSKLRDALPYEIIREEMDVDGMDYRPTALYINGEYWGLYNLRDKVNEQYLHTHRGLDPAEIDMIKGNARVLSGDSEAYEELMDFLRDHDLSYEENFEYVASVVDVDEVLDYWIAETFFANTDTGNIKIYRQRDPVTPWRLVLYDLDWCLYPTTYRWNMLRQATDPEGHGIGNRFSTRLLRGLLENDGCRQKFVERYAHHLNTTFAPDRTTAILHRMADRIESEIPRQYERWGQPSVNRWHSEIEFLEEALSVRRTESMEDLQAMFDLSGEEMERLFPDG